MHNIEPGKTTLDVNEIMQLLPHRYPFLLIDKLIDIKAGESAIGVKCVSYGDQFFQGHFPQKPVMPGVLIIEAMAQAAAAFTSYTENLDVEGKIVLFMGVDKARFRKPVVPGDQLNILVRTVQRRPPVWRFEGDASVDGKRVADATFAAMLAQLPS
ncbi:MAG TPA: 3-hydroxyacyl-ACP dehydratase FabZ [Parvularculaceae bacterium]|nr:3-hydroxyacyl-ACP dehydratase FabZ [Caulobacterales bacterium]HPE31735.1 3-hydroxyacyl-ACP dehydratase FabZ [Parvularculaceae bacterium]HRX40149.1 3-hydroxyacyl-ACP dehydratase FabZ [Parvularculaceae bacterium]